MFTKVKAMVSSVSGKVNDVRWRWSASAKRRRDTWLAKRHCSKIDIHTDKSGALRFHIHRGDRIVSVSNPYHDLQLMKEDIEALEHGKMSVVSRC